MGLELQRAKANYSFFYTEASAADEGDFVKKIIFGI